MADDEDDHWDLLIDFGCDARNQMISEEKWNSTGFSVSISSVSHGVEKMGSPCFLSLESLSLSL